MINWGIVGLGRAAQSFGKAIQEVEDVNLKGIASLSKNKLNIFGENFNIEKKFQFNSYDDLINCKEIDAIYIATLNNSHADLIIKSSQADKGILCEKPMILNDQEMIKVFDELNRSKVFFLENIAYRSHPQTSEIVNQILNKEIGELIKLESSYGFRVSPILKFKPSHRIFNKKFGGGAINDIGCYPVSFAVLISRVFQNENKQIIYNILDANIKNNFRGTDDEGFLILNFENQFKAKLEISIKKKLNKPTVIYGSKGKMIIANPWLPNKNTSIQIEKNGKVFTKNIISKYSTYANTIKVASDEILLKNKNCKYPNMTLQDSKMSSKILLEWKNFIYKS